MDDVETFWLTKNLTGLIKIIEVWNSDLNLVLLAENIPPGTNTSGIIWRKWHALHHFTRLETNGFPNHLRHKVTILYSTVYTFLAYFIDLKQRQIQVLPPFHTTVYQSCWCSPPRSELAYITTPHKQQQIQASISGSLKQRPAFTFCISEFIIYPCSFTINYMLARALTCTLLCIFSKNRKKQFLISYASV